MKNIVIILSLVFSISVFGQKIDYNNFDKKVFEKTLFNLLNEKRMAKGLDSFVFSNVLYKEASVRNMNIITKTKVFQHPDYSKVWDSLRVRELIAKESDRVIGGKASCGTYSGYDVTYYENLFWSNKTYSTYLEMAEDAISSWEKSFTHNAVQYANLSDKGKPGMASCTIGFVKGTNDLYVVFNFVKVYRK